MRRFILFILIIPLGFAEYDLSRRIEDVREESMVSIGSFDYLPSGRFLNLLSCGFENIISDYFWIKAIGLFGERYSGGVGDKGWYMWLYHLIDIATDLDPKFKEVYKYGGLMLRLDNVMVDQSNIIFEKGMENIPDYYFFPFAIGMNYFEYRKNYMLAAEYIKKAASIKGAPFYLHNLAATFMKKTGQLESALIFLKEEIELIQDPLRRRAMEVKIRILEYELITEKLKEKVKEFEGRFNRKPLVLEELVESGVIDAIPHDPFGGRFIVTDGGEVMSSRYEEEMERIRRETGLGSKLEE